MYASCSEPQCPQNREVHKKPSGPLGRSSRVNPCIQLDDSVTAPPHIIYSRRNNFKETLTRGWRVTEPSLESPFSHFHKVKSEFLSPTQQRSVSDAEGFIREADLDASRLRYEIMAFPAPFISQDRILIFGQLSMNLQSASMSNCTPGEQCRSLSRCK